MSYTNNILLDLFAGKKIQRPPVWIMRQAGRILPGYREIRGRMSSFKEFVKTPEMVAIATTEPLSELGVDAAILFSDILVIPEAMGADYEIVEATGPVFAQPIRSDADIGRLKSGEDTLTELDYVFEGIRHTKKILSASHPLIGFAGAPWTIFAYMIEGRGSKNFAKARRFLYENPSASHRLMEMISQTTISYLKEKIRNGVDLIQLFDSWAYQLTPEQYQTFCIPYLKLILEQLSDVPRILFPKGAWSSLKDLGDLPFEALGIDWQTPISYARESIGSDRIIQGNFDPALLYGENADIVLEVRKSLDDEGLKRIVNLGHGVYPDTDKDKLKVLIDTVKDYRYPQAD